MEHIEVIKYLIEQGADVNSQDYFGDSALHEAIREDKLDIFKILAQAGASLKNKKKYDCTPLVNYSNRFRIHEILDNYPIKVVLCRLVVSDMYRLPIELVRLVCDTLFYKL